MRSERDWRTGRLYQVAAWSFTVSLMCGALFGHLEDWSSQAPAEGWISERALLMIIGLLLAVSVGGLLSTMVLTSPPPRNDPGHI